MTVIIGRLAGARLPWPRHVRVEEAEVIARWAYETVREHGACFVSASVSRALRAALAARDLGLDLTGAVFRVAGEPVTRAKVAGIESSGARVFTTYGFSEIGRVGMGCSQPLEVNDLHLCQGVCAMIPYDRLVPGTDIVVPAFNFTSLLPTAPKILINAESDDYGIIEERSCECPLDELGLKVHLRRISSFQKLTGEGVTLVGSEMVRILEEDLPARFGGGPLDYQLLEEEDDDGFTRLSLLVHPRLDIGDNSRVVDHLLKCMKMSSAMADSASVYWKQAHAVRVRRDAPVWTGRGKLMTLHVAGRFG